LSSRVTPSQPSGLLHSSSVWSWLCPLSFSSSFFKNAATLCLPAPSPSPVSSSPDSVSCLLWWC